MVPTATIHPRMPTSRTPDVSNVASNLEPAPTSCSRTRPITLDRFEPSRNLDGLDRQHERPRLNTERELCV